MPDYPIIYQLNHETGLFHRNVDDVLDPTGYSMESITAGNYSIRGRFIFSETQHRFITPISPAYEVTLAPLQNGRYSLISGTGWNNLNAPTARTGIYGVAGTIEVASNAGEHRVVELPYSPGTAIGTRLWSSQNNIGNWEYSLYGIDVTFEQIRNELGPTARLATSDEVAERAIIGYLKDEYEAEINAIKDEGGLPGMSEEDNTFSNIVKTIAKTYTENLDAFVRYILTPGLD